jgi:hypothetical protein
VSWIIGGSAFDSWLENKIFSSPQHPDQLEEMFSLLFKKERGIFYRGLSGRNAKLTTHLLIISL